MLQITTFGRFELHRDGAAALRPGGGRAAALLGYLLASGRGHRRDELAELFWPGADGDAGRLNLRQLLFVLRRQLAAFGVHELLRVSAAHVALDAELPLELDLRRLDHHARRLGTQAWPSDAELASMELAAALYRAPFLAELSVDGCPDVADWLQQQRAACQRQALEVLACIAQARAERGELAAAQRAAERAAELEPCDEAVQLRLMQLLLQQGRGEAALAQYERACAALLQHVGAPPGDALRALAGQARRGLGERLLLRDAGADAQPERSYLTVLAVRLPELDAEADLEQAFTHLRHTSAALHGIVAAHGGHLVQSHGGAFIAYFGYPTAQERVTLQAVRAAVALRLREPALAQALHRGPVLRSGAWDLPDPLGLTTRDALELARAAGCGDIVASAAARALIEPSWSFAPLEVRGRRSRDAQQQVWRVLAADDPAPRAPLFGRRGELALLLQAWHRGGGGGRSAVLLRGDVGVGKTRLIAALRERARLSREHVVELRFTPQDRHAPQLGLGAIVEALAGVGAVAAPAQRTAALQDFAADALADPALAELFARLVDVPPRAAAPPTAVDSLPAPPTSPSGGRLLELLLQLLRRRAAAPTLLVLEDLQWADAATAGLLEALLAQARAAALPLLVLLSARPEWTQAWPALRVVELRPLPDADIAALLDALHVAADPERRRRMVERARGNPLYAEELAALDTRGALDGRLSDLLGARIDQLGDARATAQLAAAFGHSVDRELLLRASALPRDVVLRQLERLQASQVLEPGAAGQLAFRHALLREAAYETLGGAARRRTHRHIAETLQVHAPERCLRRPDTLARHWAAAAEPVNAAAAWLAAARRAAERHADADALAQFEQGLALLDGDAGGRARDAVEFSLLLGWLRVRHKRGGADDPAAGARLARALALAERPGNDPAELFDALWAQWESAGSRAGHARALQLAEQMLALAERRNDPAPRLCARYAVAASRYWLGDFAQAVDALDAVLARLPAEAPPLRNPFGLDLAVGAHAYRALAAWPLQQPRAAAQHARRALALARQRGDDFALAFACLFAATLERWRDAPARVRRLARIGRRAAARCHAHTFAAVLGSAAAWADAREHADDSALAALEHGVRAVQASYPAALPMLQLMHADALRRLGQRRRARRVFASAQAQARRLHDGHDPQFVEMLRAYISAE